MSRRNGVPEEWILSAVEAEALKLGSHYTVFRFSSHWKAMFGTPCLYGSDGAAEVRKLTPYPTLREALLALIGLRENEEIHPGGRIPRNLREMVLEAADRLVSSPKKTPHPPSAFRKS